VKPRTLHWALMLFWALWLTVATVTNATNALKAAGALPKDFAFAAKNLELVETTVSIFGVPEAVSWLLFLGVIAWGTAASFLLFRAAARARRGDDGGITLAFAAAMGFFAAFMLADELFLAYVVQATNTRTFAALGVTYLIVRGRAEPGDC
jgi:hypothetical protein